MSMLKKSLIYILEWNMAFFCEIHPSNILIQMGNKRIECPALHKLVMLFSFWIAPSIQVTAQSWRTSLRSSPIQTHDPWNVWQTPYRGKSLAFCSQARQPFYHQRSFILHNSPLYLTNRLLHKQEKQQNGFNSTTFLHQNTAWNPWAEVPTRTGRSTELINHDLDWILNQSTAKEKPAVVQHRAPTGSLSLTRTERLERDQ